MSESSIEESINLGAMGEALNDKMDRDGLNADIKPTAGYGVDYVVKWKVPTESDPSWYRKYASGWVEQGGYTSMTDAALTINLLIAMADTKYTLIVFQEKNSDGQNVPGITSKTTTNFGLNASTTANGSWEVKGMAA